MNRRNWARNKLLHTCIMISVAIGLSACTTHSSALATRVVPFPSLQQATLVEDPNGMFLLAGTDQYLPGVLHSTNSYPYFGYSTFQLVGNRWIRLMGANKRGWSGNTIFPQGAAYNPLTHSLLTISHGPKGFQTWFMKSGTWVPTSRSYSEIDEKQTYLDGMYFDSSIGKVILFGCHYNVTSHTAGANLQSETVFTNIWDWTHVGWQLMTTSIGGPCPWVDGIAFDAATNSAVVLSQTGSPSRSVTWEWNGKWYVVPCSTNPPIRQNSSMVFDPQTNKVVLYGGQGWLQFYDDMWEFSGSQWRQLYLKHNLGGLSWQAISFDVASGNMIMTGGAERTSSSRLRFNNFTWGWDGKQWNRMIQAGRLLLRGSEDT